MARKPSVTESTLPNLSAQGIVFISHVHEDEPLAEAFAVLIQSVTAGAIPTLRSSSKNLGEGIQYGEEWFKWICESVNSASHTVALVTPASTGRPWILFEAGLGKARPEGTVFGVALGIAREEAYKGPFGVLQNCGADKNELKKLCKQLIQGKNLNPPEEMIDRCVDDFLKKVEEHFKNAPAREEAPEDRTSVAVFQALEEMKLMLRDQELMYREGRDEREYRGLKRRRMMHPMMLEEIVMMADHGPDMEIGLLMMASMLRDDFPPLYEVIIETYREITVRKASTRTALARLEKRIEFMVRGPFMEDFGMMSKENHFVLRELPHVIHVFARRFSKPYAPAILTPKAKLSSEQPEN